VRNPILGTKRKTKQGENDPSDTKNERRGRPTSTPLKSNSRKTKNFQGCSHQTREKGKKKERKGKEKKTQVKNAREVREKKE